MHRLNVLIDYYFKYQTQLPNTDISENVQLDRKRMQMSLG